MAWSGLAVDEAWSGLRVGYLYQRNIHAIHLYVQDTKIHGNASCASFRSLQHKWSEVPKNRIALRTPLQEAGMVVSTATTFASIGLISCKGKPSGRIEAFEDQGAKACNRRVSQMVTCSSTTRLVQCLCIVAT